MAVVSGVGNVGSDPGVARIFTFFNVRTLAGYVLIYTIAISRFSGKTGYNKAIMSPNSISTVFLQYENCALLNPTD